MMNTAQVVLAHAFTHFDVLTFYMVVQMLPTVYYDCSLQIINLSIVLVIMD
jgi:hypothetical protein